MRDNPESGLVARSCRHRGTKYRCVLRVRYGERYEKYRRSMSGSYEHVLLHVLSHVFQQEPFQEFDDVRSLPKPRLLDFEPMAHAILDPATAVNEEAKEAATATDEASRPFCICTQCYDKGLRRLMVMRHTPSGICVGVGGDCGGHMAGKVQEHAEAIADEDDTLVRRLFGISRRR